MPDGLNFVRCVPGTSVFRTPIDQNAIHIISALIAKSRPHWWRGMLNLRANDMPEVSEAVWDEEQSGRKTGPSLLASGAHDEAIRRRADELERMTRDQR